MRIPYILILVLIGAGLHAQKWRQMAAGGHNYFEIVKEGDAYYRTHDRGKGSGYVQYMRWKADMQSRTHPSGKIRNFSAQSFRAYQHLRQEQAGMRSVHGQWEELGPTDYSSSSAWGQGGIGRINRIAFHPADPMEFWVGAASGGLWKTTDGGTTWTTTHDAMPQLGISGIVYDHAYPDTMYVLTGDGDGLRTRSIGVLKSEDAGVTWQTTGLSWGITSSVYGYKLVMHPQNHLKLYAATTAGLWATDDGGENWSVLHTGVITDLEFCPSDTSIIYATRLSQPDVLLMPLFLKTTDSGISWDTITTSAFPDTSVRAAIAISPSVDSVVYVIFGGGPDGMDGFFKSTDFGSTFSLMSSTPNILGGEFDGSGTNTQAGRNNVITVDPTADNVVYVGGINVWKSTDSGVAWERKSFWTRLLQPYVHADFLDLQFRGSTLYVCNDGGVYKTSNGGDDWTELSAGLSVMQFYEIDVHGGEYTGGTQDNGTNGASVGDLHTHHNHGGDGFGTVIHYGDNSITYLTSQNNVQRRQFGVNVDITPSGLGDNDLWFAEMEMHIDDPDYVLLTSGRELYRGNGNASEFSWDSMRTSLAFDSTNKITCFAQGTDNPSVMYVSNGEELLRSSNANDPTPSWSQLTGLPFGSAYLEDVEVDPSNSSRVWVCFGSYSAGDKVYFSPDAGTTWFNQTWNLPNVPTYCLIYEPGSDDGLYIGTDIGIFYRDSSIGDWIYFSNGLPPVIVKDLDISGGYLYAGTFGRGLWRSDLYTSCPVSLTLTPVDDPSDPASTGIQIYHALQQIESTRTVQGGLGTDVQYNAGINITLKPGFKAYLGNIFRAQIAGCPD